MVSEKFRTADKSFKSKKHHNVLSADSAAPPLIHFAKCPDSRKWFILLYSFSYLKYDFLPNC